MAEKTLPVGGGPAGGWEEDERRLSGAPVSFSHDLRRASSVIVYADGLCEPTNPGGWGCWGWVAVDDDGREVASDYGCLGHGPGMTNNQAEYVAALRALRWAADCGLRGVVLRMDSQLVVNQATGRWGCHAAHLIDLLAELRALIAEVRALVEWVPRERNARADELSRRAYAEARGGGGGR